VSNLAGIRSRLEALQRHAGGTDYASQVIADNLELVDTVERLREDHVAMLAWLRSQGLRWEALQISTGEYRREVDGE